MIRRGGQRSGVGKTSRRCGLAPASAPPSSIRFTSRASQTLLTAWRASRFPPPMRSGASALPGAARSGSSCWCRRCCRPIVLVLRPVPSDLAKSPRSDRATVNALTFVYVGFQHAAFCCLDAAELFRTPSRAILRRRLGWRARAAWRAALVAVFLPLAVPAIGSDRDLHLHQRLERIRHRVDDAPARRELHPADPRLFPSRRSLHRQLELCDGGGVRRFPVRLRCVRLAERTGARLAPAASNRKFMTTSPTFRAMR